MVVVGGGLAGSEAAWQAARTGSTVILYEMRPARLTEAHKTGLLAELVCSNSFKSESLDNANGLLKLELKMLGSLLVSVALETRVPAGSALCVDRAKFAARVTAAIESCPGIALHRREVEGLPDEGVTVLAPGPLAPPAMAATIETLVGSRNLFFYDAVSPIIEADSIDMTTAYTSSRYGKGEATYVNLPVDRRQYLSFVNDLRAAELHPHRDFEDPAFFRACMPIEEVARMGDQTLAFGCMKPVGLEDPRTGALPCAVVQLRPENVEGSQYGMVGFQTRLRYGEQERIFRKLPGLGRARFVRFGSIHRNTYICGPSVLAPTLQHRNASKVLLAGQVTGSEGYMAAAATGLVAGINAARLARGASAIVPPEETLIGGLVRYVSKTSPIDFKPTNVNFGLLPGLGVKVRDRRRRNLLLSERSVLALRAWMEQNDLEGEPESRVEQRGSLS